MIWSDSDLPPIPVGGFLFLTRIHVSKANASVDEHLQTAKQFRERCFQPPGNPLDIHQRDVSHPAFKPAVICSVQPATLGGLFLIDLLLLADAADGATKPDANIYWHWV